MTIAIDTTMPFSSQDEHLVRHLLQSLSMKAAGVEFLEIGPASRFDKARWVRWQQPRWPLAKMRTAATLRKHGVELLISPSLRDLPVASCLMGSSFLRFQPHDKIRIPGSQASVFCHWESERTQLIKMGAPQDSIIVIDQPSELSVDDDNKPDGGQGVPYLLCMSDQMDDIRGVLKGYSIFKKRMQTQLRLTVLTISEVRPTLEAALANYKYRDAVTVSTAASASLLSGAEAIIVPSAYGTSLLKAAMTWGKDLIVHENLSAEPTLQQAALFFNPGDAQNVSSRMIESYVQEGQRKERAILLGQRASSRNWEKSISEFYSALLKSPGPSQSSVQ